MKLSLPILFQRLEGLAVFIATTFAYFYYNFSLVGYLVLILIFDLSMLGYLFNNKIGAITYNFGHSFFIPVILLPISLVIDNRLMLGMSLLWLAHIGLDRALGFGLKQSTGFKHTHLGDIGS